MEDATEETNPGGLEMLFPGLRNVNPTLKAFRCVRPVDFESRTILPAPPLHTFSDSLYTCSRVIKGSESL